MQEGKIVEELQADGIRTIFRYPRWSDLDGFIEMHRTLSVEKVMARRLELDPESGGRMLAEALIDLRKDRASYLLVERDGRLVGEGFITRGGYQYFTVGLALIEHARGIGIGTRLMWALESEARRLRGKRLFLTVWSENPGAIRVYEKVGYQKCGRRPDWIRMDSGETCDLVLMYKVLD